MKGKASAIESEIIKLLKRKVDSYLSGQTLSNAFGISRTAVWKHIKTIKEKGYDIEATPARGYRLNLQRLPFNSFEIGSGLKTSFIGKDISFYNEIDSTNDVAKEVAAKGAAEGTAVIADCQKKGRGRLGRKWESPKGVNIYTSIILRPNIPPASAPQLTLFSAVAMAETVSEYLDRKPDVKWPNDILINSKKVAGILTEMNSEQDRINFIVLGIGVNLNMTDGMFPEGLKEIATSLKIETGRDISRTDFIQALYLNMEKWYKNYLKYGFESIREAWTGYFAMAGRSVKVREMDGVREGIAMGIDSDGALLLKQKGGHIMRTVSGDMAD